MGRKPVQMADLTNEERMIGAAKVSNTHRFIPSVKQLFQIQGLELRKECCATCPAAKDSPRVNFHKRRPRQICLEDWTTICAGEYSPTAYIDKKDRLRYRDA